MAENTNQTPEEELHDPLGEMDNATFDALAPAEKGARTRRANELAEAAANDEAEEEAAGSFVATTDRPWITAGPDGKPIA